MQERAGRRVTLFLAVSLDGFLADRQGGVDWLAGQEAGQDDLETYEAFIREIDTVLMGWNTYRQITAALSPGEWPYEGLQCYVLTHRQPQPRPGVCFVKQDACALVRQLKEQPGKGIWICGGADLAGQLMRENAIDRYHLSVIPTLLGDGIRLFGPLARPLPLRLVDTCRYNGIVDLVYERR